MKQIARLVVPEGVSFSDLGLTRTAKGLSFDWAPIRKICEASNIDIPATEENITSFLAAWYFSHLEHGGPKDPVMEDLLEEISLEDQFGSGFTHPSGTA